MKASAPMFLTEKKPTWISTWSWIQASQDSGWRIC